jgi:hypothetical protein
MHINLSSKSFAPSMTAIFTRQCPKINLLKDYQTSMETEAPKEKMGLYDEYMEEQRKKAEALCYGGKIPSHQH